MDADDKMDSQKLEILKRNLNSSGKGHIAIGLVKYFSETTLGDGYLKYESWLNDLTSVGAIIQTSTRNVLFHLPAGWCSKKTLIYARLSVLVRIQKITTCVLSIL